MNCNTIITIGRQYASGGREVGRKLAAKLGISFYDDELLDRAAKESGICQELFVNHDEKPTNSFLYSLVMDTYSMGYASSMLNDMPLNHKVFLAQFNTIKKIADEGPCVMIGRCADYALAEYPNLFTVFIYADMQFRIDRVTEMHHVSDSKARDMISKNDKQRASYYNYYTSKRWGDINSYDLCMNTCYLGIDGTVDALADIIRKKEGNTAQ